MCPKCQSTAAYKYGNTKNGRQRYLCLMCGRQFTPDKARHEISDRPVCPACGKKMYCYMRETGGLRFRCSGYPACRTYKKITPEEGLSE